MTDMELRKLYSEAVYCELDEAAEKELSEWELNEVFIPIMDEITTSKLTYTPELIESFVELCFYKYYMMDDTYYVLLEKYNLPEPDEPDDSFDAYLLGLEMWKDTEVFSKVAEMNAPNKEKVGIYY